MGAGIVIIQFQQYNLYWLYHANTWGRNINFDCFCAPLRAQGWEIYNFNNISFYWIYHANNWGREVMFIFKQTNKGALTAGNKIIGYSSRAALAKDMLVIPLGKSIELHYIRS